MQTVSDFIKKSIFRTYDHLVVTGSYLTFSCEGDNFYRAIVVLLEKELITDDDIITIKSNYFNIPTFSYKRIRQPILLDTTSDVVDGTSFVDPVKEAIKKIDRGRLVNKRATKKSANDDPTNKGSYGLEELKQIAKNLKIKITGLNKENLVKTIEQFLQEHEF
jgi:hypothetical protein